MQRGLLQLGCFLLGIGVSAAAMAFDHRNENLAPGFKFQKNESLLQPRLSSTLGESHMDNDATSRSRRPDTRVDSYDAIFYYPLHRRGVSLDLGLNLRLQQDQFEQTEPAYSGQHDWLNIDPSETRPLIHAAAVFDLPFKGFKAGISGTYNPDLTDSEYDYRAKLSYKWRNGLGLEGGWQHQQNTYEQRQLNDRLDVQTLFLDMNYRF